MTVLGGEGRGGEGLGGGGAGRGEEWNGNVYTTDNRRCGPRVSTEESNLQ